MVSASLRMLLDDGDDLEMSEATPSSTSISSSSSSVEADARLLMSLASPMKATSLASLPRATRFDVHAASRATTPSINKTCSTLLRSIALQSQQAPPLVSPTSSSSTPSTPSLANIVDASLLFRDHSPSHSPLHATTAFKVTPPATPAASNAPLHSNMVILRELSDLEHSMTCEFCNCLYASPDSLRKHILSRHGLVSWRQSVAGKNELTRPRQKFRHPSPHRQASHNRRLPLQSPRMARPPEKPVLQDGSHVSDPRFPPHPPQALSRTLSLEQPHKQQQEQPQKQYQALSRDNEQLFAEHLYHRQRLLSPPFTSSHHSTPDRLETKKSQYLSSHTSLYLPSPQSRSGTGTAVPHFTPIAVDHSRRLPQLVTTPQQQQHKREMSNNLVKLPSLKAALERTLEETESPCSSCIQRGERCFRDFGNKACRSCLVAARPCDLRPHQHAPNNPPILSNVSHVIPPVAKVHPHLPLHALPPEPRHTAPYTSAQNLGLSDIARSLPASSPQLVEVTQDPEENDKFKLPKASKPAPPPDAPAFSSSSLTRESASHLYHSRQSRHAPIPVVPGAQPVVFQGTVPPNVDDLAALRLELAATSRSARNAEERRQLSFQIGSIQRSQSDPYLLPAYKTNAKGPATITSSHSVYAKSRKEPPFREQQSLPNQINGFSASHPSTQPQLPETESNNAAITQPNRKNTFQVSISDPNLSAPPGQEQNSFGHKRWLEVSNSSSEAQIKRVRLASPEEGSLPEDKRGTTVKRPRKTIGVWQTRRPQTACEDCRSKKLGCSVEPGRTSCERCIRKNLPCYLKSQ